MAYDTKSIKLDKDGKPIPQYFNPTADDYEPILGEGGAPRSILHGLGPDSYYIFSHELKVDPPPGHLATFGQVSVEPGQALVLNQISFGGVRTIGHSISDTYTFSIDSDLSLELYGGFYKNCLNLGSPYRMIFNAKGNFSEATILNFPTGLLLLGGEDGSTYSWKIKNENPMYSMTGNVNIIGQFVNL